MISENQSIIYNSLQHPAPLSRLGFFFQEHGPISSLYTVKMDLKLYYDSYQILCHFQVFQGNNDQETVVSHVLPQHIRARFVRFWPKTWTYKYRAMRAELYGCFLQ